MNRTCLLLGLLAAVAHAAPQVTLLSSIDGKAPTAEWKYARRGQQVRLFARVTPHEAGTKIRWIRLDPTDSSLDNTQPSFQFKAISYARTEVTACRDRLECDGVDALDILDHSPVSGTGTAAFALEVTFPDGKTLRTADESKRVLGGIGPDVHRITVRRDDSYLGHLTELFGTPYIFGSSGVRTQHQTDLLMGSDCADLAVYGMRRLGAKVPYVSTWTIDRHAKEVALAAASVDGKAQDKGGRPISVGANARIREGDLLLFPRTRHVGVLYEDRAPRGILDEGDLLLHTCWAKPTVEPIGATSCASFPIRILRPPLPARAATGSTGSAAR